MSEPIENRDKRKPFQYSLRSLLIVTTGVALLLGLIKWQPVIGPIVLIALVLAAPAVIVARSRSDIGQIVVGIGIFVCVLLIAVPFYAFPDDVLFGRGWFCLIVALGVIGLPAWMSAMIIQFAWRYDRLNRRPWRSRRHDEPDDSEQSEG
jgi:hypothetical protein